ncbi:RNA polymerase sigma-70 factor [Compostibacter hankyongensis]|uniref:RNA polymerase sigma-70 factor n=1 Tax=Compostibacter hankyongensis TaxID=1007089 RepID=A0ABP8G121_9BACT
MAVDTLHEHELFRRIAQGDEGAFREIFDRYRGRLYAAALKMTRSAHLAEEIVQESFVTLWLHRLKLETVDRPSAYLFTIAQNAIYAHFRKGMLEKKMRENAGARLTQTEYAVEERLVFKERQQLLQNILRQLPLQQQLVYQLSKQEGLSRSEIADRLQVSPHTVKNHLLKAVKYIRTHFHRGMIILLLLFA